MNDKEIEAIAKDFIERYQRIFAHDAEKALRTGFVQSLIEHECKVVDEWYAKRYDTKYRDNIEKELREEYEFKKAELTKAICESIIDTIKYTYEIEEE